MKGRVRLSPMIFWLPLVVFSATSVAAQSTQAEAQEKSEETSGSEQPTTVCMVREKTGPARGRSDMTSKPTKIVVPERVANGLARKGFQTVDCTEAKLNTKQAQRVWRDEICTKAAYGNQAVQNQYARLYGARPAALCAAAQRVAGKVDKEELLKRQAQAEQRSDK